MDMFTESNGGSKDSLEYLCEKESDRIFRLVVTMVSMLNKKFYSPVAFILEYYSNKNLQAFIEEQVGLNYYDFFNLFLLNYPTIIKSRKLKKLVLDENRQENT